MSDTKALYGVVADALANWGNSEAMDAFEALMGRLNHHKDMDSKLEAVVQRVSVAAGVVFPATDDDVVMAVETLSVRLKDAEADNAALVAAWQPVVIRAAHPDDATPRPMLTHIEDASLVMLNPHPGAALLEEVEGMRHTLNAIGKVLGFSDGSHGGDELVFAVEVLVKQLDAAHNAALEEAAKALAADGMPVVREMQHAIRALKKTGQGE